MARRRMPPVTQLDIFPNGEDMPLFTGQAIPTQDNGPFVPKPVVKQPDLFSGTDFAPPAEQIRHHWTQPAIQKEPRP